MKIIYTAGVRIPTERAHGIHIMKMCEAFALLNHEVELVVPKRFNKISKDPFEYYGVKRNFKITKLPCLDLIPLDKYIGILGLYIMEASFLFFLFFYLLFKKTDFLYIRDKLLLPIVFIKKNSIFETHTYPVNDFLYAPFIKKIKAVVVITRKLKEQFGGKAIVAPDGVDLEKFQIPNSKFQIREKLGLPQDKKIVLYAGHLYSWKGVDVLAEASQYLPENTEVYLVGGTEEDIKKYKISAFAKASAFGSTKSAYGQTKSADRQNSKIRIMGHRPHSEIPYWLKAADVLILPNSGKEEISRHWTSPLKMFEYMASSVPIVASDLPSIREILSETNAVLVESDNPLKLAEGIKKVLEDGGFAQSIANRAFNDVQEYTWQKRAGKILSHAIPAIPK